MIIDIHIDIHIDIYIHIHRVERMGKSHIYSYNIIRVIIHHERERETDRQTDTRVYMYIRIYVYIYIYTASWKMTQSYRFQAVITLITPNKP